MDRNVKMRLLKEAHKMCWGMTRHIYPITSVVMELDFPLYKEFGIHQQYRDIVELHEKLQESIKQILERVVEEDDD